MAVSDRDKNRDEGTARLFDPEEVRPPLWTDDLHGATTRRLEGETAALDAVSSGWKRDARATIRGLAADGRPFTAEDVRRRVGDPPGPSSNALGALFAAASRAGTIVAVGWDTAGRDAAHGRALRVWRGRRHVQ